jgi:bifunctional DNase/RNase
MEAELVQLTEAVKTCLWLKKIWLDFYFANVDSKRPLPILVDNSAALAFAHATTSQKRTKHIAIRHHFVRERIANGDVSVHKVHTLVNLADIFTKPLSFEHHSRFVRALNIYSLQDFLATPAEF